ncbi:MAG TPA: FAD-dependent monooxygenase [Pseudonocardia sp.]|nr:FAD-dependent monooxygenase [Pseudonocardia sp.]
MGRTVLISGASVAGPVLAYWLSRLGFTPTVVERTPRVRLGTGGHAVDLFGPAVEVVDRMGLLDPVEAARTRTDEIRIVRAGGRYTDVRMADLVAGLTEDRHVEIMRGELAGILHGAVRDDVEHLFGDAIHTLDQDPDGVDVTFEHGPPRRFDLVVGADGLHSGVRGLAFGAESRFSRFLGGYLAAFTLPGADLEPGRMLLHNAVDRLAGLYPVWQTGEARAVFLFRAGPDVAPDHRDVEAQRWLLRRVFATDGWEVPRLLDAADHAADFYLDSISQIRMDSWTRGRVTLVGDAGYSPGPAVGGGTTIAAVGAYVLAHQLAAHPDDHAAGLRGYEHAMRELVVSSREIGPAVMKTLVPRSRAQVALTAPLTSLVTRLPAGLRRRLLAARSGPLRVLGSMALPEVGVGAG